MGLSSSLNIGRTALSVSQLALQVAGNNIANAATPGYSRQVADLRPAPGSESGGISLGRGVLLGDVRRRVDEALTARLNASVSRQSDAQQELDVLSAVETTLGELSDGDFSSQLAAFFNAWSELGNGTGSESLVVQQGQRLSSFAHRLRGDLVDQRTQVDRQFASAVHRADDLLTQIADLNQAIVRSEIGNATASSLRDQRDTALKQLSELIDVTAVEQPAGNVDVLVGSIPVVLGSQSRGLTLKNDVQPDGSVRQAIAVTDDLQQLNPESGQIGALLRSRKQAIDRTIDRLDTVVSELIFQVNRLHSTGTNARGLTSTQGTLSLATPDRSLAMNDPANVSLSGLPFRAVNGGFLVNVTQSATGTTQTVRVDVDLDGINSAGEPGFEDDTSAGDITAAINAIDGLTASLTPTGQLKIDAQAGFEFSFSQDSSGALAVLGVNAYFTGTDASDVAVRPQLVDSPSGVTTGRLNDGVFVENGTAIGVANLQDASLTTLSGDTLSRAWLNQSEQIGAETASARTSEAASTLVRESLESQQAAVSGVSIDEESVNLLNFQRQYQGAARFITIVDQLTQTLLSIV